MQNAYSDVLKPTLWRTCRVLANLTRLKILRELCLRPEQQVSGIAMRLGLSIPLASQSLRALNARGLLGARRAGKKVFYRPEADHTIPSCAPLLMALAEVFAHERQAEKRIYLYATAFTHLRRIRIISALRTRPMLPKELARQTGIPLPSLQRHLRKLTARGFVMHSSGWYICAAPRQRLARLLQQLACASRQA